MSPEEYSWVIDCLYYSVVTGCYTNIRGDTHQNDQTGWSYETPDEVIFSAQPTP